MEETRQDSMELSGALLSEPRSSIVEPRPRLRALWREWLKPFLIIAIFMLSFRSAVADWNHVPTGSMKPTILEGDRIFVNKLAYDLRVPFTRVRVAEWSDPRRGDVVVFLSPVDGKRLVKRVIGIPGDVIEIRGHRLTVNGKSAAYGSIDPDVLKDLEAVERHRHHFATEVLDDTASGHPIMTLPDTGASLAYTRIEIPSDRYFVMGDNRDDSADSRVFGLVAGERVLGRATAVALSVDPNNYYLPRWDRFFTSLP